MGVKDVHNPLAFVLVFILCYYLNKFYFPVCNHCHRKQSIALSSVIYVCMYIYIYITIVCMACKRLLRVSMIIHMLMNTQHVT